MSQLRPRVHVRKELRDQILGKSAGVKNAFSLAQSLSDYDDLINEKVSINIHFPVTAPGSPSRVQTAPLTLKGEGNWSLYTLLSLHLYNSKKCQVHSNLKNHNLCLLTLYQTTISQARKVSRMPMYAINHKVLLRKVLKSEVNRWD